MSSRSSSSSTTAKKSSSSSSHLISRTAKHLSLSAGVSDQLHALEQFRARDSKIKSMVTGVSKKAAQMAERGNQRQLVEQWQTTWQTMRADVVAKETDFIENVWPKAEDDLFELMNFFGREEGLMFVRRTLKAEGDELKKCFQECSAANIAESPLVQTSSAIRTKRHKLFLNTDTNRNLQDDHEKQQDQLLEFISSLRLDQEEKVQSLEQEYQQLCQDLSTLEQKSQHHSNNNNNNAMTKSTATATRTWFLEPISAPKLSAISSEWIKSYEPLRKTSPELFHVFTDHQESQQLVLEELARVASLSRDALLECASSRDLSRLWDLWSTTPTLAPGGRSKRDRVLSAAKAEFDKNNLTGVNWSDILDLMLSLRNQKQQLRSRYSSALESTKEQMRRLDDVVIAFQTLQEAENVHETFLTQLEQEHSETKEREAKLRSEKEIRDAQRAAEAAVEEEKEQKRLEILREKQQKEAEEKQNAVAKWLEEKAEKQRQEEEEQHAEEEKQEELKREQLDVARERVRERARIDEAKQHEKDHHLLEQKQQEEREQQRLLDFYAKTEKEIGAQRDPKRVQQATASTAESAALPSVGESTAKFSRTGHGFSTDKVVKDARFRLSEALSMAGLQNSSYGRSVLRDTFASKTGQHLAARSMGSNFNLQ